MANDDYFVLVYRILKYFYACFKEGKTPDKTFYSAEVYKINEKYWSNINIMSVNVIECQY